MSRTSFFLLSIAIAIAGGGRQAAAPPQREAAPAVTKSAAAPAVGEGLCVEHGVLETVKLEMT